MNQRVKQAFDNISKIILNTKLTAVEHKQLEQDLLVLSNRCVLADTLEKEKQEQEDLKKKDNE